MPSPTYAEFALLDQDELVQGIGLAFSVLDTFTRMVPVRPADGKAAIRNREATDPSALAGTVDVNGALNATQGVVTQETHILGRIAGEAVLDSFARKTQSSRSSDHFLRMVNYKLRGVWQQYSQLAVTGTNAFPQFAGLNYLNRQTYAPVVTTAGAAFSFALLDELLTRIPRGGSRDLLAEGEFEEQRFFLCPSSLEPQLYAAYRALGAADIPTVMVGFQDAITGERKPMAVPQYRGVPIFFNDAIGTETTFGASGKTRITAGLFGGEHGLWALVPPNGPFIEIDPPQRITGTLNRASAIELITGFTVGSSKALVQAVNLNGN